MPKKSPGVRYSEKQRKDAARMAKSRVAVPEISSKIGVSQKTIRDWLRAAGVSPASAIRRQYDRKAILRELASKTRADIIARHGCSQKFLSQLATGKITP
jgi:uncharacterized protein YjcR